MKKSLLLVALLLAFTASGLADTTYNNFQGYSDYWHPLGYPDTATYGEVITAPTNGDTNLADFTFYMGNPVVSGDIILGAYVATWTGSGAGTLVASYGPGDWPNSGPGTITATTGGLNLTGGQQYVIFLSVSQYYGQSFGQSYIVPGSSIQGLDGFVYNNNGGDFNALFTNSWSGPLTPDWAVNVHFTGGSNVPEPGTLMMLGTGLLGGIGALRRKLF
jgi:hypothetical protein